MPYDKGHDAHTATHQAARYGLRKGMARVALQHKTGVRPATDVRGKPMRAMEMAERHSTSTLQRWANGYSQTVIGSGMDFCKTCHRIPQACAC